MKPIFLALAMSLSGLAVCPLAAEEVIRNAIPGSDFPIAESVEIPAGASLVYVSGAVPPSIVEGGDPADPATFGDTETQTSNILAAIEERLQRIGLDMGDVVMMRAYLVADPATGEMDFSGFMRGYTKYFGTEEQPGLPARSAFEIEGLVLGGWLVEIEVQAARVTGD